MKIELKNSVVDCKNPKGKHQLPYIRLMSTCEKSKNPEDLISFIEHQNNLVMELTGYSKEDLDELDTDDIKKIKDKIQARLLGADDPDFTKPSPVSKN